MKKGVKGVNQNDIQEMNRSLLIHLLREHGLCTRSRLAQLTGLQPATVTNIINDFLEWGLVKEEGSVDGEKGRRAIGVRLDSSRYYVIGLRLSHRYFSVGLFDLTGKEMEHSTRQYDNTETPKEIFALIRKEIQKRITENNQRNIIAIGVAIPGPFIRRGTFAASFFGMDSMKEGRIALMPEFLYWHDVYIKPQLEEEFHIPVYLEHDANVAAVAGYWRLVCGRDADLVYILAGHQGIGAGIITNGKLYVGGLGSAGEIGHTCIQIDGLQCECGGKGCLEKYCSTAALTATLNGRLIKGAKSILRPNCGFEKIAEALREGDGLAVEEYTRACKLLSIGISTIINLLNPHIIVIGDTLAAIAPELLLSTVMENLKSRIVDEILSNTQILVDHEKTDTVLAGACIYALEETFKTPSVFQNIA
jgi:predicted NBD/HSP70 family sugar kinase